MDPTPLEPSHLLFTLVVFLVTHVALFRAMAAGSDDLPAQRILRRRPVPVRAASPPTPRLLPPVPGRDAGVAPRGPSLPPEPR